MSRFLSRFSPIRPLGTVLRESHGFALDEIVSDRAVALRHCDRAVAHHRLQRGKGAAGLTPLGGERVPAEVRMESVDARELADALVELAHVLERNESTDAPSALSEQLRSERDPAHLA